MNYLEKLKEIDTFIFDVDGVYTDGQILLTEDGSVLRSMNIRDGYATQLAVKKGIQIIIISGGKSEAVKKRFEGLGVKMIFLGVEDKYELLHELVLDGEIEASSTGYMGDDVPDLEAMQLVDFACCPQDAIPEIHKIAQYVSPINGGAGCVREVLEKMLKVQDKWAD